MTNLIKLKSFTLTCIHDQTRLQQNDLHDLPLKFSRSAGTPLSLVSAISAAKFIILLSLTGLLNLADIVKKNQSYVHKNTLFTKFRCQTDALSESHECFTRRQV